MKAEHATEAAILADALRDFDIFSASVLVVGAELHSHVFNGRSLLMRLPPHVAVRMLLHAKGLIEARLKEIGVEV